MDDDWNDGAFEARVEAMCLACCRGDLTAVRRMLAEEPTLLGVTGSVAPEHRAFMANMGGENGWSPLHLASHYGQVEVVRQLVAEGADVNVRSRNKIGNRPLGAAVAGGRAEVVKVLLEADANVNATDVGGLTALHLAMGEKRTEIAELLIAAGADREARDKGGRRPGEGTADSSR